MSLQVPAGGWDCHATNTEQPQPLQWATACGWFQFATGHLACSRGLLTPRVAQQHVYCSSSGCYVSVAVASKIRVPLHNMAVGSMFSGNRGAALRRYRHCTNERHSGLYQRISAVPA